MMACKIREYIFYSAQHPVPVRHLVAVFVGEEAEHIVPVHPVSGLHLPADSHQTLVGPDHYHIEPVLPGPPDAQDNIPYEQMQHYDQDPGRDPIQEIELHGGYLVHRTRDKNENRDRQHCLGQCPEKDHIVRNTPLVQPDRDNGDCTYIAEEQDNGSAVSSHDGSLKPGKQAREIQAEIEHGKMYQKVSGIGRQLEVHQFLRISSLCHNRLIFRSKKDTKKVTQKRNFCMINPLDLALLIISTCTIQQQV